MKRFRIALVALAALLALTMCGCGCSRGGGENGGGNNGNNGGNGGTPVPAKEPSTVVFDWVGTYNGTTYVASSGNTLMFCQPAGSADQYRWFIEGTEYAPLSNCFGFWEGKLFYVDMFRHSDAAGANVTLFCKDMATGKVTAVVDDVDADSAPVIIDGVLYYVSYRFTGQTYNGTTSSGTPFIESDMTQSRPLLVSYNLSTGAKSVMEIPGYADARYLYASVLGATDSTIYLAVYSGASGTDILPVDKDLNFGTALTITGTPLGVTSTGRLVHTQYGANASVTVCDMNGQPVMEALYSGSITLSGYRYLMYFDTTGVLTVTDVNTMEDVLCTSLYADYTEGYKALLYYDPAAELAYFYAGHPYTIATYKEYGENGISVFSVNVNGLVKRQLADLTWRKQADWKATNAYVLQWSELDVYSYDQLATLTDEQLFYGRNEMFWAHGFNFNTETVSDADLQAFFSAKTWPRELTNSDFTDAELTNLRTIMQIEKDRKSPYADRGYTMEP